MNKIYWKDLLSLIEKGEKPEAVEIDFKNEMIDWKFVRVLFKNGFKTPKDLIDYDDEHIDYSDIPSVTDEIINRVENDTTFVVNVDEEIAAWLRSSHIDFNNMINQWLHTVYESFEQYNQTAYQKK